MMRRDNMAFFLTTIYIGDIITLVYARNLLCHFMAIGGTEINV